MHINYIKIYNSYISYITLRTSSYSIGPYDINIIKAKAIDIITMADTENA